MTLWVCLGCRTRVVATNVPRKCKKCRASSAWFRPEEPAEPKHAPSQHVLCGKIQKSTGKPCIFYENYPHPCDPITNSHPTAR